MKIEQFLKKENNNLDLIRIFLASFVILGHTIPLNGTTDFWIDPITFFFPNTYSGAISVKIFFFISGLVVTNSYLNKNDFVYFIIARLFRILPALFFLCLITVFVIGPIFTNLTIQDYFSNPESVNYLKDNMLFKTQWVLPGVFKNNYYKDSINGSLWSLHFEMYAYLFLMISFLIVRFKKRIFFNLIFIIIIIDTLLPTRIIFNQLGNDPGIYLLPFSFALGSFFAINSKEIRINYLTILFSLILYIISKNRGVEEIFLILFFCIMAVYISSLKIIMKFKPKNDISYGIYLWGFLIQQIVFYTFGKLYAGTHFIIALVFTLIIAYISFIFIEKPFINLGKKTFSIYNSNIIKLKNRLKLS